MSDVAKYEADIIIKGAGPIGLSFANLLGTYGIKTLVLEQNSTTVEEPRAVGLDVESGRALQAMGLEEITAADMIHGFHVDYINANDDQLLDVEINASPYGRAQMASFIQPIFEKQLCDGLNRFDHVTMLFNHRVDNISQSQEAVIATGTRTDGTQFEAQAKYLVGCGGGRSLVRKTTGIKMLGYSNPQPWLVIDTIDPSLDDWVDVRFFCDPARPAMTIKKRHQHRRWEWMLHPEETEAEFLEPERINALLAPYTNPEQVTLQRKCVYSFNSIVAEHYRQGRLFLAGDAAHMMPPFAGQGMNSGMRDAINLSWKLAAVIKGDANPSLLDTYEIERRDHVVKLTKIANRLGSIIMPTQKWRAALRDLLLKTLTSFTVTKELLRQTFFVPPKHVKGLFVKSGAGCTRRNGEMIVQPQVTDVSGKKDLLDNFLAPGFVVLGIGQNPLSSLPTAALDLCRQLKPQFVHIAREEKQDEAVSQVTCLSDSDEVIRQWLGNGPAFLLVRPDRFVATGFDAETATSALTSFIAMMRQ